MPVEGFGQNLCSPTAINIAMGVVVAVFYLILPLYGYWAFAVYYVLMSYEFYHYMRTNWDEVLKEWHGDEVSPAVPSAKRKRWARKKKKQPLPPPKSPTPTPAKDVSPTVPRVEYPPPLDSADEISDGNNSEIEDEDIFTVDMPDNWDPVDDVSDDNYEKKEEEEDRYYDATSVFSQN